MSGGVGECRDLSFFNTIYMFLCEKYRPPDSFVIIQTITSSSDRIVLY